MVTTQQKSDKAVISLDLWLTLIAERDGTQRSQTRFENRARFANEILKEHGLAVPQEAFFEASSLISQMVTCDHDLGLDLEFKDRVSQMLALVDPELPERLGPNGLNAVADAVDRAFTESPPGFLPGAKEVLQHLKGLDVDVALISNTGLTSPAAYREWFDSEGVLGMFDQLVFSNEVACAKPNPGIFNPVLENAGVRPENGLHIGDNLLTDICGAAGVGMRTGWISGHDARAPIVEPDYTLESVTELPAVVERWLETMRPITA